MSLASPFAPGEVFAGRYEIERLLGAGGMGVVVAARHVHLDDRVAIKFLRKGLSARHDAVERFLREARAATKARNDHIGRVFDAGAHEGTLYMVMELLEGENLAEHVAAHPRSFTPAVAIDLLLQTCEAVAAAHDAGVVHRDLKPENLFLVRRPDGSPFVKVLDFGISKIEDANGGQMTTTSTLIGSPLYMSPEQLADPRSVDRRADIWALGIILYELLAGQHPFQAASLPHLCVLIREKPPASLRERCPAISPALEAIVMRCLAKAPSERFATARELAAALRATPEAAATAIPAPSLAPSSPSLGPPVLAQTVVLGAPTDTVATPSPTEQAVPPASTSGGGRGWLVALVISLGLAVVGATLGGYALLAGPPAAKTGVAGEITTAPETPPIAPAATAETTAAPPPPIAPTAITRTTPHPRPATSASARPTTKPSATTPPVTPPAPAPPTPDDR